VYAYALRIYFDFSGYTDLALGIARLLRVRLPENFDAPYLKPNLTQFWNSWHMSLSNWFRAYWFNPLTRALRKRDWAQTPIVLLCQTSTMLLIALWHGVTVNFVLWGLWHAAGLFVHNRWAAFARARLAFVSDRPALQRAVNIAGALLTFHFVALGWVFFALSTPGAALAVFRRLTGAL
jgi:D-alanyl-lipoteichoic acid acyltransferase DltB (MBOAT superfamily)